MKKSFISIILSAFVCVTYSQIIENTLKIGYNSKGQIQSIRFLKPDNNIQSNALGNTFFEKYLKTGVNDSFVLNPNKTQSLGLVHEHFDQYYKKVKVEGGGYNLHFRDNNLLFAHGNYVKIDFLDVTPSIDPQKAFEIYAAYLKVPLDSIERYTSKLYIKVYISPKDSSSSEKLVYQIFGYSNKVSITKNGIIDAHSGEVLELLSNLVESSAVGTFATRYNGTKTGNTSHYSGNYHLRDSTRGAVIITKNLQNNILRSSSVEMTDNDNNWTAAEYSASENDMALDVHWACEAIYDYLHNTYNVNSWNNAGAPIKNYVRYANDYLNANNAWWDISDSSLLYGDGRYNYNPWSSLDVVAHEFGHAINSGVIDWNTTSFPGSSFSEGLSDVWAIIMDYRLSNHNPWVLGEQIDLNYGCLRNFKYPHETYNGARYAIADTYLSSIYNSGDSHVQGGLFSHMFYLLVNGGTGTNDLGRSYNVKGIGFNLAEQLFEYAVFNNYLRNTVNWQGIRENMVEAAYDYLNCNQGYSSILANQIDNAWSAVGVGPIPTSMSLSGNWLLCFSSTPYTLNGLLPYSTLTWSCSSNITRLSPATSNPCNFKANLSGSGWIKATVYSQCDSLVFLYNVWAGTFENTVLLGPAQVCPYELYTYTAQVPGGPQAGYSYTWTYPSGWFNYGQVENSIHLQTPRYNMTYGPVRVSITNQCGSSLYNGITTYPATGCHQYLAIYPNPASDDVTITINEPGLDPNLSEENVTNLKSTTIDATKPTNYTIRIFNNQGGLKLTFNRSGQTFTIPLGTLQDGIYIVELNDGKNSYRQQVVVKRN